MSGSSAKNYHAPGGDRFVVGGRIELVGGGAIYRDGQDLQQAEYLRAMSACGLRDWVYTVEEAVLYNKPLNVVCIGDSITSASGGYSYVNFLRTKLQSTLGYGGRGFIAFNTSAVSADFEGDFSPLGMSGATTNTLSNFDTGTDDIYDPNFWSAEFSAAGYINLIEKTRNFDSAQVFYLQYPGGGTFLFGNGKLPDGQKITQSTSGEQKIIAAASYSAPDTNHFQAKWSSGHVRLMGVNLRNGSAGVRVHRIAQGGAQAAQFAALDGASYTEFLRLIGCDLAIIQLGMNDSASRTAEQYETDIRTICERVKNANDRSSIILVGTNDTGVSTEKNNMLNEYRYRLRKVLTDYNAVYFDTRWALGTYANANAKGWMTDTIHPNRFGSERIGDALYKFIGGDALKNIEGIFG